MSRFANAQATARFVLGPCACEGTPHDQDWMLLRTQLGGLELVDFSDADPAGRLRILLVEWNLHGDDGRIAPMDDDHLRRLYSDTFEPFNAWLSEHLKVSALPNASGAPSPNGSRASASQPTQMTQPRP